MSFVYFLNFLFCPVITLLRLRRSIRTALCSLRLFCSIRLLRRIRLPCSIGLLLCVGLLRRLIECAGIKLMQCIRCSLLHSCAYFLHPAA